MFVTTCCDIVSLNPAMCQSTYLFDLHNHPEARTHFYCAGEAPSIRQLLRVTQLEKGRAWIGTHRLALGRGKQTSTHTAEAGRFPTPHCCGIAHQDIFILLCWHHLAQDVHCQRALCKPQLGTAIRPDCGLAASLLLPPFLGWFLLTAV